MSQNEIVYAAFLGIGSLAVLGLLIATIASTTRVVKDATYSKDHLGRWERWRKCYPLISAALAFAGFAVGFLDGFPAQEARVLLLLAFVAMSLLTIVLASHHKPPGVLA